MLYLPVSPIEFPEQYMTQIQRYMILYSRYSLAGARLGMDEPWVPSGRVGHPASNRMRVSCSPFRNTRQSPLLSRP